MMSEPQARGLGRDGVLASEGEEVTNCPLCDLGPGPPSPPTPSRIQRKPSAEGVWASSGQHIYTILRKTAGHTEAPQANVANLRFPLEAPAPGSCHESKEQPLPPRCPGWNGTTKLPRDTYIWSSVPC